MPYPHRHSKRNESKITRTQETEWPAKRGDYVTLVLASLAISTVITLLIIPQLHQSPFF